MTWGDELVIIRRLLRDPDAKIWSDNFLLNIYNEVQRELQHKTSVLEDVAAQRVPGLFHFSYMYDWEYSHLPSGFSVFYQCLAQHDEGVFCHRWETQQVAGIDSDVSDYGCHFTQPFEAFMGETPGEQIRIRFPAHMRNLKFIAYDNEPISQTTRKAVQSRDSAFLTTEGSPCAYYENDDLDGAYILYPRPAASFADELDGDGVAFYATDDTEDVTTGTIATRTGDTPSSEIGVSVDIIGTDNNIFLVFDVRPTDIETTSDEGVYPEFLKKYIRYGVVSQAYGGNNDGRIPSLSAYWGNRFTMGVEHIKKFVRNKFRDRDYRLTSSTSSRRSSRRPRLPDHYPATRP